MDLNCPLPQNQFEQIVIGHGGGGRLTQDLLKEVIAQELGEALTLHDLDGGFFTVPQGKIPPKNIQPNSSQPTKEGPENLSHTHNVSTRPLDLVFTTDSFVVDPIFFPGGDIGKLSVVGTVNDIAMMGAEPIAFSLSFILEEGFLISDFRRILRSMGKELEALKLKVTCGDTKVVPRGKADKIFINTSAVGVKLTAQYWQPLALRTGDVAILTRDIGSHGMAVLCARNQLGLKADIQSDCHELLGMTKALISAGIEVHCARDLTRGGLLSAAVEIAATSGMLLEIEEELLPKQLEVQSVCELLGLDIFSVANEGTAILFVAEKDLKETLEILRSFEHGKNAARVGRVIEPVVGGKCLLRLASGATRRWTLPPGELLPRIC